MPDEYAEYEEACARIRAENEELLEAFAAWLRKKKLKDTTVRTHVENIDFYINEFLLYEDAIEARDGALHVGMFLGYWFIRKAMWSSQAQIKRNAASLKKFYTFMHETGRVSKEKLDDMKEMIKEEMPDWLATMQRYDDPSVESMAEVWGLEDLF